MVDATFVEVPRQRNRREENAQIKAGATPADWPAESMAPMCRQKDGDARWAKKNDENHYGYKNHINADQANKLVQSYAVTIPRCMTVRWRSRLHPHLAVPSAFCG